MTAVEPNPAAHPRIQSISADDPARTYDSIAKMNTMREYARDYGSPKESGAKLLGVLLHQLMQNWAAHRNARGVVERRFRRQF